MNDVRPAPSNRGLAESAESSESARGERERSVPALPIAVLCVLLAVLAGVLLLWPSTRPITALLLGPALVGAVIVLVRWAVFRRTGDDALDALLDPRASEPASTTRSDTDHAA